MNIYSSIVNQIIPLIVYVLATAGGLILIKIASNIGPLVEIVNNRVIFHFSFLGIIGVVLYGISFILYTFLIAKNDLGYIIPLTTALVYILIFFASFVIFKEVFTALKIVAIFLIIMGVILLNVKQ